MLVIDNIHLDLFIPIVLKFHLFSFALLPSKVVLLINVLTSQDVPNHLYINLVRQNLISVICKYYVRGGRAGGRAGRQALY